MVEHKLIQSVIFKKDMFAPAEAIEWLRENNFKFNDIHTTSNYHRFRQFDPDYTDPKKTFITVRSKIDGIKYIVFIDRKDLKILNQSH